MHRSLDFPETGAYHAGMKTSLKRPWQGVAFTARRKQLRLSLPAVLTLCRKAGIDLPSRATMYRELDGPDALGPAYQYRDRLIDRLCLILEVERSFLWKP